LTPFFASLFCSLASRGFDFDFKFINDWYEYQNDFVSKLDISEYFDKPLYRDRANLSEVIVYKNKKPLRDNAEIALYGDRVVIDEGRDNEMSFPFEKTTALSVLGRNKLNIYFNKQVFQLKGDKHFNALKYVNLYYRHKNVTKGEESSTFLGI